MIPGFDEPLLPPEGSVRAAVLVGREKALEALSGRLAARLDDFPEDGRDTDYVSLAKQLAAVMAELAELRPSVEEETELEKARRSRADRRSAFTDSPTTFRRRGA